MADTLNQTLVTQYTDLVHHKVQQLESFTRGKVIEKMVKGKKFDYQLLGAGRAKTQTTRHEKVTLSNPQHTRVGAICKTHYDAVGIDAQDAYQALVDLDQPYVDWLSAIMARKFDDVVAEAALGSVLTGEDLTTETAFAGSTVDATSTGLTYDKMREILKAFRAKGVGLKADEEINLAITEQEHDKLLDEIEVISGDYRKEYSVEKGRVTNLLGMNIIVFPSAPDNGTEILGVSSGTRDCFAFASSGICVGINSDIDVQISDRPDMVDTKQLKATFRLGALRTEDAKVVKVNTTAS